MSPMDTVLSAFISLWANKLRSTLTVLGIVIGVAAVISLMSIGRGAQASITANIQSLGTNLLFVQPGAASFGGIFFRQGTASTLTLDDAYAMMDTAAAPSVNAVAPELSTGGQVVWQGNNTFTQILGVTPEYVDVRNMTVASGGFISNIHVDNRSEVVVMGSLVAETLFGLRDPVGQVVKVNERRFTVIGILESEGGGPFGILDDQILVPITTAYYRLATDRTTQGDITVSLISVQVRSEEAVGQAESEVATLLRLRHRLTGEDDFSIFNQQETIETLEETTNTFVVFLGAIAGISLLVGGIGIMNIMLVSVTERTREIGIRKAMGAKRRDILLQFMAEATVLSIGGGGIGVLVGVAASRLVDGRSLGNQTLNTVFSGDIVVLAMIVSAVIGMFFGIYPAMRAARQHPIDALRYE